MVYPELSELLYHGSDVAVSGIDISKSAPRKDFGCGFYTTNDIEQAKKFARLKAKRAQAAAGFVSVFRFKSSEGLLIRRFASSDATWFDFVLQNRGYSDLATSAREKCFDIVIGPVADDAVGLVLNQFVAGTYGDPHAAESKATALRLLLAQRLHNQVFFGTEMAASCLHFLEVFDVDLD